MSKIKIRTPVVMEDELGNFGGQLQEFIRNHDSSNEMSLMNVRKRMWSILNDMEAMLRTSDLPKTYAKTVADLYKLMVNIETDAVQVEANKYNVRLCKTFILEVVASLERHVKEKKTLTAIINEIEQGCDFKLLEVGACWDDEAQTQT